MAPRSNFWSKRETEALKRNYPKFGSDTSMWDETISRDRTAIAQKANRIGIIFDHGAKSKVCEEDYEKLKYVLVQLSEKMGLSMREIVYEMAIIANKREMQ